MISINKQTIPAFNQETTNNYRGHWLRRVVHLASILIPLIYFQYSHLSFLTAILTRYQLMVSILVLIMMFESLRLQYAWVLIGQRNYENTHISGFVWGICASFLIVLTVNQAFAFPLIVSYAVADPVIGELRAYGCKPFWVWVCGLILVATIWLGFIYYFQIPAWWLALLIPPITVAAEWPKLTWIDDNALMQIMPWAVIGLCQILNIL